jgi:HK97 family phage portal protein
MSRLLNWIMPQAGVNPDDPRWWNTLNGGSEAGVKVTADVAMTLSTFWACVRFLSETIGALPLVMYRRNADGSRERATNHPLYDVLHTRPNQWQTAVEFISMMQGHALLRGNAYARIVAGERGPVDQLIPLHPDRVTVETLANGRLRYTVKQGDGSTKTYTQDEIFHLRGMSSDGVTGLSVVEYAANSVGLTLAAERYGSRFFRNDSRPGGVLSTDKKLSAGQPERMKERWRATQAGASRGDVAILEEGLTFQAIGVPPEEAQFLGTREHQALDVCRWFNIPPHMVGVPGGVTEWGSGLEQMGRGMVVYTLMPWLVRWQQAIGRDLILAPQIYYAEFVVEGLLRGDIAARYGAYSTGRQWGWLSVNEIRMLENLNPVEGGDVYLQPLNMVPAGSEFEGTAVPSRPLADMAADPDHYAMLAEAAAGRLVRKEVAAMAKARERAGDDKAAMETAVREFYAGHAKLVAETMAVSLEVASVYCMARVRGWLMDEGGVFDGDEEGAGAFLMGLAMGGV